MLIMPLSGWDCARSAGGVDSVCQLLLKGIAEDKDNQYLIIGFNPFNDVNGGKEKMDLPSNIRLHWYNLVGNKSTLFKKIIPNLFHQNWIVKREVMDFQPDVIHSHLPSWFLFKYDSISRILTLHSYKNIGRQNFGILNHILYVWFASLVNLRHATLVTTVSKDIENLLRKEHHSAIYIPNPILDDFFHVERKQEDKQIVVLPASVIPKKRIHDALKVIEKIRVSFPKVKLYIAGMYKKNAYYNELVAFIAKHKLQANVEFLGQISVRQLCEVYSKAQAGLFLSEEETFGLAPLEMIAAGLPIVTTKVGVLKHEKAFVSLGLRMVNVGDIQGATEGLSEILMAKLEGPLPAVDFIRKNYSLSSITNQYLKMYQW
jgi:glycosyltransferase involved in cell wall biosynthesis